MTETQVDQNQAIINYRVYERGYRIDLARWAEIERRRTIIKARLMRIAMDSGPVSNVSVALGLNNSRLYQIVGLRGRAVDEAHPATPLDAILQPLRGSSLDDAIEWEECFDTLDDDLIDALRDQWIAEWKHAMMIADLDHEFDSAPVDGPMDEWWFRLAPQTIEAALGVQIE